MQKLPSFLERYLDSEDEEEIWWGHPHSYSIAYTTLRPILALLAFIGFGLLIWALFILIAEVNAQGSLSGDAVTTGFFSGLSKSLLTILAALFFFGFRWWLKWRFEDVSEKQVYYIVSDQRVQVIEHNKDDPRKSNRQFWGPGDIRMPSYSNGTLHFVETPVDLGKVENINQKKRPPLPRKPVQWSGFTEITEDEAAEASAAIEQLLLTKHTIKNAKMGFSFELPADWTLDSYFIPPERRDDTVFNVLTGGYMEQHHLIKRPKVINNWNTVILTRQHGEKLTPEKGALSELVILIEAAVRPGIPKGFVRVPPAENVNLDAEIHNRFFLQQGLGSRMLVTEFRKGYRITQQMLTQLFLMENRNKQRIIPDEILKNLGYFKDWETSDKKLFKKILQLAITKRLPAKSQGWLKDWILEHAEVNYPFIKSDGKKKLKINAAAALQEVNISMNASFVLKNVDISLPGKPYRFRQIYMYHAFDSDGACLHLRLSFFCHHHDKSKIFDENVKTLEDIANSIKILN